MDSLLGVCSCKRVMLRIPGLWLIGDLQNLVVNVVSLAELRPGACVRFVSEVGGYLTC